MVTCFEADDTFIDDYDFYKRFGTLHCLLIDLFNRRINTIQTKDEPKEMMKKISGLHSFISLEEKSIKRKQVKNLRQKNNKEKTFNHERVL